MEYASLLTPKRGLRLFLFFCVCLALMSFDVPRRQNDVAVALNELRSPSEAVRFAAKQRLLTLGEAAIPELVSALQHLIRDMPWVFELGMDAEGEQALKRRNVSFQDLKKRVSYDGPPDISGRWKQDILDLLAQSKARQAVPVLLEALRKGELVGTINEPLLPEMEVLVAIGEAAVPQICEAFINAEDEQAASRRGSDLPQEQERAIIESGTRRYRAKLAIVLGKIGDPRALSLLDSFLNSEAAALGQKTHATFYVENAVRQIQSTHR